MGSWLLFTDTAIANGWVWAYTGVSLSTPTPTYINTLYIHTTYVQYNMQQTETGPLLLPQHCHSQYNAATKWLMWCTTSLSHSSSFPTLKMLLYIQHVWYPQTPYVRTSHQHCAVCMHTRTKHASCTLSGSTMSASHSSEDLTQLAPWSWWQHDKALPKHSPAADNTHGHLCTTVFHTFRGTPTTHTQFTSLVWSKLLTLTHNAPLM